MELFLRLFVFELQEMSKGKESKCVMLFSGKVGHKKGIICFIFFQKLSYFCVSELLSWDSNEMLFLNIHISFQQVE
jgi:hypothetical protein